ncbi:MAG: UDP-N-acetylglucosamine--N-acetylmuramyl-(pentapeptide) pyrophosphoryl-undecaprenol N-acetylglucosamine transferase, partial [Angelakisella sp.]
EIIRRIKPDIVVGTGGYAGYPMVCAAQKCGVKTAILEPNATPGFVTKRTSAKADCVMICFPQTRDYIGKAKKIVVTGIPVRQEIMECTAREYSPLFENKLPTVASFWGSVGAKYMNDKITEIMAMGYKKRDFNHLHGAGKNHYARMSEELSKLCDYKTADNLELKDYIFDMDRVMAKADLIISRGGASTIAEICAAGKPSIIVPSPYVTENHQEKNARVLEKAGAAIVLTEEEATAEKLYETALALLCDKKKLAKMGANARAMSSPLALEKIYDAIMETAR